MDIKEFQKKRPCLYHLTSNKNLTNISSGKLLFSTKQIVKLTKTSDEILRKKRTNHITIGDGETTFDIRDQRPISEKLLRGCLLDGMTLEEYYELLNERVFWWPTLDRLSRHFNKYAFEKPKIICVKTSELFEVNPDNVEFSRLNSGALRANSYLNGKAPDRGRSTFVAADKFEYGIGGVAEVTFLNQCKLPIKICILDNPLMRFNNTKMNFSLISFNLPW